MALLRSSFTLSLSPDLLHGHGKQPENENGVATVITGTADPWVRLMYGKKNPISEEFHIQLG